MIIFGIPVFMKPSTEILLLVGCGFLLLQSSKFFFFFFFPYNIIQIFKDQWEDAG